MSASALHILAICGSTRAGSANHQLIKALEGLAGEQWHVTYYEDLDKLPYFNPDLTGDRLPASAASFLEVIARADAVLICTPEYVFSLPGILKNALEWTVSSTVFSNKPAILLTASSSGHVAHESLVLIMKTLGVRTSDALCLHVPGIRSKLNAQGAIADPSLKNTLMRMVKELEVVLRQDAG